MQAAPSTTWSERVAPDEAARHAAASEAFVAMQKAKSARFGNGRALHRKPLLALRATLRVREDLPPYAAHGLFATPGAHETWIRLSNGGTDVASDRTPDIRGFSLRVLGVSGPSALGGEAATHQDFALINRPAFAFPDSKPFVALVMAAAKGPLGVLGWARRTYGFVGMFPALKRLKQGFLAPFTGFATERFFSAAPIACGPYAARVRLVPPGSQAPSPTASADWAADVTQRLAKGPLVYRLQLQFFVDEARTPIEDASVDWSDDASPYVDVADLVIEPQDVASPAGVAFAQQVEAAVFDPWQAVAAHRPLGEVMRARKAVYFASQKTRGAA
jgi:hypothetical protein